MIMESYHLKSPIFQSIIDALPLLLFWTDRHHVYLGNNVLHAESFGYSSPDQLVGVEMAEMFRHANFDDAFLGGGPLG